MNGEPLETPVYDQGEEQSRAADEQSPRQQSTAPHPEEIDLVEIWYDEVGFTARLVLLHVNECLLSAWRGLVLEE
jgi:hypothetical protein